MISTAQIWIETSACIAALFLIPLYMGLVHVPPVGALAYAGVGGVAMAVGEELQFEASLLDVSLADVPMWSAAIAVGGGIAYALALFLV